MKQLITVKQQQDKNGMNQQALASEKKLFKVYFLVFMLPREMFCLWWGMDFQLVLQPAYREIGPVLAWLVSFGHKSIYI